MHLVQQHGMSKPEVQDMVQATKASWKSNPLNFDKSLPAALTADECRSCAPGTSFKNFQCLLCDQDRLPSLHLKCDAAQHLEQHGVDARDFVVVRDGLVLSKLKRNKKQLAHAKMAFELYFVDPGADDDEADDAAESSIDDSPQKPTPSSSSHVMVNAVVPGKRVAESHYDPAGAEDSSSQCTLNAYLGGYHAAVCLATVNNLPCELFTFMLAMLNRMQQLFHGFNT